MAIPKDSNKGVFTYSQYKNWPDEERWELIDGEAYDMSPAPGMLHQYTSGEFFRQVANYLDDKSCKVFTAPFDVFLPRRDESGDDITTVVQPDISIICSPSKLSEKGCTGPPDVVIEIISPYSASRDQITKLKLYEKRGIKEYWIIHPLDRIAWKYILNDGAYGKPSIYDQNTKPSFNRFPDFQIDLTKVFGVKDDEVVSEPSPKSYRKPT